MTACRTCSAPIKFVTMAATGKPMPIDCHPDERGNLAATPIGRDYVNGRYLHAGEQPAEGEVRLMPHFGTCNDPRKPGRPRKRPPPPPEPLFDYAPSEPPPPF